MAAAVLPNAPFAYSVSPASDTTARNTPSPRTQKIRQGCVSAETAPKPAVVAGIAEPVCTAELSEVDSAANAIKTTGPPATEQTPGAASEAARDGLVRPPVHRQQRTYTQVEPPPSFICSLMLGTNIYILQVILYSFEFCNMFLNCVHGQGGR